MKVANKFLFYLLCDIRTEGWFFDTYLRLQESDHYLLENYNHFSDADEKFNDRDISSPPPSLTRRKSVFDRLKHFIAIGSESIEDTESDGRG